MKLRSTLTLLCLFGCTGCLDLALPSLPPPPGPGTLQGTLVYSVPGRVGSRPAGGARVQLVNATIFTLADPDSGRFLLGGITERSGQVLVTFDSDNDGSVDRQKVIDFETVKAGPGRDVELGEVSLGRNATLSGTVTLADRPAGTGQAGTTAFVPGSSFLTATADDGSFMLDGLPEGLVRLSFFRVGYGLETRELELASGQESRVAPVSLKALPPGPQPTSSLAGQVRLDTGEPVSGAEVRAAVDGKVTSSLTDDDGRFTLQSLSYGVYQLGVEKNEITSLRLSNVFVGPEANDVGVLTVALGPSVDVDLGETDAGTIDPTVLAARVSPNPVVVAPGAQALLDGSGSTGSAPLIFHWRQLPDAGAPITFTANDASAAASTSFIAPGRNEKLLVSLVVTDSRGVDSAPTEVAVLVGQRPIAIISTMTSTVVGGGAVVLSASNSSISDSQRIVSYRWHQESGPPVVSIDQSTSRDLAFIAPDVAAAVPIVVSLQVTTDLGITSDVVTKVIVIAPASGPIVVVSNDRPNPLGVKVFGDEVVTLSAIASNLKPADDLTYSWSLPANQMCFGPGPDGGPNETCIVLSGTSGRLVSFVAPLVSRSFVILLGVFNHGRLLYTVPTTLEFINKSDPSCNVSISQLALRVWCDRSLSFTGTLDAGVDDPLEIDPFSKTLVVRFSKPLVFNSTFVFAITGAIDLYGNAVPDLGGSYFVSHNASGLFRSSGTSSQQPRPGFVGVSSFGPQQQKIVGRMVQNVAGVDTKMLWTMDLPFGCPTSLCPVPDQTLPAGMAGPGSPVDGTTTFVVGTNVFAAISTDDPQSGLFLYTPSNQNQGQQGTGVWSAVQGTPQFLALGTGGDLLWAISTRATNMGLQRWAYDPFGKIWSPTDVIDPTGAYTTGSSTAMFTLSPEAAPVLVTTTQSNDVRRFAYDGAMWQADAIVVPPSSRVRAAAVGDHSFILTVNAAGQLSGTLTDGSFSGALASNVGALDFDVISWSSTVLVAYAANGGIFLGMFDRSTNVLRPINPSFGETDWNTATPVLPGSFPRFSLWADQLVLTWQALDGTSWRMAGRMLR